MKVKIGLLLALACTASGSESAVIYETDYSYDSLDHVNTLLNDSSIKGNISGLFYSYNENSLIASVNEIHEGRPTTSTVYNYDANNRLLSANTTSGDSNTVNHYAFDLQSNLRQEIENDKNSVRLYNARNALIAMGNMSFSYDAAGNLMSNSMDERYQDNALNELTKYNDTLYEYDGNGERLSKSSTKLGQESFYYDNQEHLVNSTANTLLTSYFFGVEREGYIANNAPQFYQYDLHGSVIGLGDNAGNVAINHTPFRYSGYFFDSESGLYYLNARYYNPATETFLSQDTYAGNGTPIEYNRYLYVNGDWVNNVDKTGHMANRTNITDAHSLFQEGSLADEIQGNQNQEEQGILEDEPVDEVINPVLTLLSDSVVNTEINIRIAIINSAWTSQNTFSFQDILNLRLKEDELPIEDTPMGLGIDNRLGQMAAHPVSLYQKNTDELYLQNFNEDGTYKYNDSLISNMYEISYQEHYMAPQYYAQRKNLNVEWIPEFSENLWNQGYATYEEKMNMPVIQLSKRRKLNFD